MQTPARLERLALSRFVAAVPLEWKTTGMYLVLMARECRVVDDVSIRPLCLLLSAPLNRSLPPPYHRRSFKPFHDAVLDVLLEDWACARLSEFDNSSSGSTVDSRHLGHQH